MTKNVPGSLKTVFQILKATLNEFNKDRGSRMSAALAFYTVFSLAPLLIALVTLIKTAFKNKDVQMQIMEAIYPYLGPKGVDLANSIFATAEQSQTNVSATIASIVVIFFGASTIFVELKESVNHIFNINRRFLHQFFLYRILGLLMIIATGIFLILSFLLSAGLAAVSEFLGNSQVPFPSFALEAANFLMSILLPALVFGLAFRYLPARQINIKTSMIGGLFTAVLFSIGKSILAYYLGKSAVTSLYGAAGTLVVFLIWIYYTSQIFFFGAELCKVLACRNGEIKNLQSCPETT